MSSTTDVLNEIYPLIQQSADRLFPEFGFKRISHGFEATCGEINGSSAKGHLYCYDNTPFCFVDNKTGENISIWDYVKSTRGLTENREVLLELAKMAGYTLPSLEQSPEDMKRGQDLRQAGEIRETYLKWTQDILFQAGGGQTLSYLQQERGYTDDDIRKMGLGHNPGWEKSLEYLQSKGFSREQVERELRWLKARASHLVVIPHRDQGGRLVGLWGRVIDGGPGKDEVKGKYMPLTDGSAIGKLPFGIDNCVGETTVVGVEGLFDARTPAVRGLRGVVGWGRKSPTGGQLATLQGMGVKNLVLIPDNDAEGKKGLEQSIRIALGYGFNVFVVELPAGCKDLDQFVVRHGVDAFKELAKNPLSCHRWMGKRILEKHDLNSDMGERETLDEIVSYEGTITDPLGRRQFMEAIGTGLKLSEDALDGLFRDHREHLRQKQARDQLSRLGKTLINPADDRSITEIKAAIERSLATIAVSEATIGSPFDPQAAVDAIQVLPENLPTGYETLDRLAPLRDPSLLVIGARVAHGKTTFTLNIIRKALEQEANAGKPFVIVSLEVPPPRLLCQMIGGETGMGWLEVLREIRSGMMSQTVMDALSKYRGYFEDKRLYVISDRGLGVDEVCTTVSRIKEDHGQMGLVAVDYLGLLANREVGENVEQKYSMVMNRLTTLSHELVCPVIVIAQINREADKNRRTRRARMPRADQLRYSGQIESDADAIWGLFNVTHDQQIDQNDIVDPDETAADAAYVQPTDAQIMLLSLKDRYGPGFRPINFRMTNGVRIEEWNSGTFGAEGDKREGERTGKVTSAPVMATDGLLGLTDDDSIPF